MKIRGFILAVVLMFAITLGFVPGLETAMTVHAVDDSGVCSCCNNIMWELDGTTLTISKVSGATSGDMCSSCQEQISHAHLNGSISEVIIKEGVKIPGGICDNCRNISWHLNDGKLVIKKAEGAISGDMCDYCDQEWVAYYSIIEKGVIEDGVTRIGDLAFENCVNLKEITIPDGVTSIGEYAFWGCEKLTEITIPVGVTNIGNFAFLGCESLTSITIPGTVTSIGTEAFGMCYGLTSITLPDSLTSISESAFYFCSSLTSITIPNSVTSIGESAFNYCYNLTNITIPCTLKEQILKNNVIDAWSKATISWNHLSATYTVNDTTDTLSLTCASCENAYTVTLKAPTQTVFTGKPIEATCTGMSDDFAPTITYSGNKLVDGKPVYPGTYTATLTYGDKKVSLKYTITEAAAPAKPHKITNVVKGVHVYWTAVEGVSKYGLWRSETGINGTYKWIANPTVAHFTDTKVESGKTYYYKVTTLDTVNNVHSAKSAAIGITFVSTPDITKRENKAAGVVLSWEKINGASGYAIYRKPYSGNSDWTRVGTIDSPNTLTWTDTSVKTNNGGMYRYTIRALAGSDRKTLSGCLPQGRTMVRLTSRTLSSATKVTATSIKCSWDTTSQATGYEVRFMVGNTVYKTFTVGNYKTGVKTFTGLKAGQTYKIQVRAYKKVDGVGQFISAWSTAKTVSL